IYVRSRRAGERIMESITTFIERKLKLKVNHEKSAVDRPWKRKFLGFTFTFHRKEPKVRIAKQSIQRFKQRIREITSRKWSISMKDRIEKLNRYLVGWLGYYQLADTPSVLAKLDGWIRRRLRMIRWKEWKKVKTKHRNLKKLGIKPNKAWEWANTRLGYWRIAKSPILDRALDNHYWLNQGLKSLFTRYQIVRST
ncbi:group II intron reverse transcriptase/maturase, partial [Salmonella enterica]|nr:group II intron reverse transcriptase/maturase [Salmonella enterica]